LRPRTRFLDRLPVWLSSTIGEQALARRERLAHNLGQNANGVQSRNGRDRPVDSVGNLVDRISISEQTSQHGKSTLPLHGGDPALVEASIELVEQLLQSRVR
jgi:hypothetical protein